MTAPTNQYLRVGSASAAALGPVGTGVEAESVQDMLNNMHPAVAVLHAIFEQPACDSVKPYEVIDFHDIDRSTTATTLTNFALGAGQSTTVQPAKYPDRLFTRLQTYHEGVAASRESQQIRLYGIQDALDYGIDNLLVRNVDIWERILHFEQGDEDAAGTSGTPANPEPRTHGLISWASWFGLENRHGTSSPTPTTLLGDGMQDVKQRYWNSFFDANGTPLGRDMFYEQILGPAWRLGHDSDGAMILCGDQMMTAFADFNFVPGRGVVNERNIPARDQAIEDIVQIITTPAHGTVYLVPDRFLSIDGASMTFNNTGFSAAGTINKTLFVDEIVLSVIPDKFKIETLQGISYKELSTDGDYALGMLVAQKALSCKNLFGVAGGGNLRP